MVSDVAILQFTQHHYSCLSARDLRKRDKLTPEIQILRLRSAGEAKLLTPPDYARNSSTQFCLVLRRST